MADASVQRSVRMGVAVVAVLAVLVAALAIYAYGIRGRAKGAVPEGAVAVTITSTACEPNALTVPAGPVTFAVTNKSDRVLEWEILDGVMVVEERENIVPGFVQTLKARLEAGTYQITCGLLSNPRGTLTVTPVAGAPAGKAPELVQFIGAIAEYKVYVSTEATDLAAATAGLVAAIKSGDLGAAQAAYAAAHGAYLRLKPAAELFGDLDAAIDARPDYFKDREKDPGFGGFRRIAYGLFHDKSLSGLAPVADALAANVAKLVPQLKSATLSPENMVRGAARLLRAGATPDGAGDGAGLADLAASLAGAGKIVTLLQPLARKTDGALADRIDTAFRDLGERLAKYRRPDGTIAPGVAVDHADGEAMMQGSVMLSDNIGKLGAALGLE